jgi:hypothetical protein
MVRLVTDYQTDHLLLLVGSNPLPNLIAAKLLLKPGGTLHLIYSRDTTPVASRLQSHLACEFIVKLPQAVKEAQPHDIFAKIRACVQGLDGTVGLHYTGGTKAMAVHAYRAVEDVLQNVSKPPVFSYLDAASFELCIDPDRHEKVLMSVKPKLEELVRLHGCYLQVGASERESLVLQETARALAQLGAKGIDEWRGWCENTLREQAHSGRRWKSKTELQKIVLSLPTSPRIQGVVEALKRELDLPATTTELSLDPKKLAWPFDGQKPEYLCRWLDGIWLEQYVLAEIVAIKDEAQIHDWGMSLQTDDTKSPFKFEFDVAAMRGYQFFGISCTTSKSYAKSKLFEAYIRARQLGGDEARMGLLSGSERVRYLENEVTRSWDAEGKIKVFGPQHLPELRKYLKYWFEMAA